MPRFALLRRTCLAGLCALAFGLSGTPSLAAVSEQAAARTVADRFEVEVLRVRPGDLDGRAVWFVTVMQPEGSSNATFKVHTLAVDRESGALVPSFRHHRSGYSLPPAAPGGRQP